MSAGESAPTWSAALEKVVKREAEEAAAHHWLHEHASRWTGRRNDVLQIPSIILATVTGFISATADAPPVVVGALSLIVGTLNTLNSYFKFSQRSEAHRIIAQLYLKVYKNIQTELALPFEQRTPAEKLLADLRERMARIAETAPILPAASIAAFKGKFPEPKTAVPIVANGIEPVEIFVAESQAPALVPVVTRPRIGISV